MGLKHSTDDTPEADPLSGLEMTEAELAQAAGGPPPPPPAPRDMGDGLSEGNIDAGGFSPEDLDEMALLGVKQAPPPAAPKPDDGEETRGDPDKGLAHWRTRARENERRLKEIEEQRDREREAYEKRLFEVYSASARGEQIPPPGAPPGYRPPQPPKEWTEDDVAQDPAGYLNDMIQRQQQANQQLSQTVYQMAQQMEAMRSDQSGSQNHPDYREVINDFREKIATSMGGGNLPEREASQIADQFLGALRVQAQQYHVPAEEYIYQTAKSFLGGAAPKAPTGGPPAAPRAPQDANARLESLRERVNGNRSLGVPPGTPPAPSNLPRTKGEYLNLLHTNPALFHSIGSDPKYRNYFTRLMTDGEVSRDPKSGQVL